MKWSIITDSSCEYSGQNTSELTFEKAPFIITVDDKNYIDDASLCVDDMISAMEKSKKATYTACPSPESWYKKFMAVEQSIAITISSGVSGSFNSAKLAREMALEKCPNKKIFILDSLSAGSALSLFSQKAEHMIHDGLNFEAVAEQLQKHVANIKTIFALSSFDNLVKNGRINKVVGMVAGKLGIWGIGGATNEGRIITKDKVKGKNRMMSSIIEDMKKNNFHCGNVIITHCQNHELAVRLKEKISEVWEKSDISIFPSGGLCSYYAERGGLIIAYEA